MSESLLSGRFGEPEGGRLLSQKEKAALENLIRNEVILNQLIINEQTGGGSVELEWAAFDEDAVEIEQGEAATLSCELVELGTYKVTSTISGIGRPIVTPVSTASSVPAVTTESHPWFTTTSDREEFSAHYDPVTQKIWATDYNHSSVGGPDRIAIGSPFSLTPETYWYLPTSFPLMIAFKGNVLHIDLTFRLAIVQARNQDNSIQTSIFVDMDNLTVFPDHMQGIAGGVSQIPVIAYSDDYIVSMGGGVKLWSRDSDGIPDTLITTYSSSGGLGGIGLPHGFIEDNNGHFWFRNSAGPSEWERYPTPSGTPSRHAIPGGTYAVGDDLRAFRSSDNSIYFVDSAYDHLWKISCDSPYTITQVTSSPYGSVGSDPAVTIDTCTAMLFTHDLSKIIFIRGGDTDEYLYFVDPSDGSIDAALVLPHEFATDNYRHDEVAHWGNFIATTGDRYLQIINYTVGNGGTDLAFTPPLFGARRESLTEFIVEFWNPEALPQKVKMNCGFQIYIARDPS